MKHLTCEMCGSTDLLKQEGVFVCQSCGSKYSVEEAKKMMVEGTVEVQGSVTVQNAAQVDNLLHLAHSSFDSKNYAQAENFCNQVIAIDGANYEAWKLKGEAINFQISGKNDRIEEVYNCIMTSYKVLDEDGQDEHREEVLESLRVCLEGEIDFALKLFQQDSSEVYLERVKKAFIQCASNILDAYKVMGYSNADAENYKHYIMNYFIKQANKTVTTAWYEVVYKNYHRGGFTEVYHPDNEIFLTFITQGDNLISLLLLAEGYFTSKTSPKDKWDNYNLQNQMHLKMRSACSYKRMVSTTTNGYGAVISREEYWEVDRCLTEEAKAFRMKQLDRTCKLCDQLEVEIAKQDPVLRKQKLEEWIQQRDSLNVGLEIGAGFIVKITLLAALAICSFTIFAEWLHDLVRNLEWFAYILGGAAVLGLIYMTYNTIFEAKLKREVNMAYYERLDKQIKELSKK